MAQIGRTSKYDSVKYKKLDQNNESDPSAYNLTESDTMEKIECTESCYSFQVILEEIKNKKNRKADFLILVGTRESSWANLCKVFGEKNKKEYDKLKSVMQTITAVRIQICSVRTEMI